MKEGWLSQRGWAAVQPQGKEGEEKALVHHHP